MGFYSSKVSQDPWGDQNYIERIMLDFYSPEFASVSKIYYRINGFREAFQLLAQRDVLVDGRFNFDVYHDLLVSDKLIDYRGWYYAEIELQTFMASYLYVSERVCRGACT